MTSELPVLPHPWRARVPEYADIDALVALRRLDQHQGAGENRVDANAVASEVAGEASWTRRQLIAVDAQDRPHAWISVHDRAAGLASVGGWFDRDVPEADQLAEAMYAWAERSAVAVSRLRGVTSLRLEAGPFAGDEGMVGWLTEAGYVKRRTWLHMSRPVTGADAPMRPRDGVRVRPVEKHENGMPVAADLQIVHRMLEESFEDHFNSYRESFPEFVQRLREHPGHRWDHWWLAFVDIDGRSVPAGTVVGSVLPATVDRPEGSYVEYIGVSRAARGRGVAKSLLATVIADAAGRGRDRVGLEVDADSPTNADALYRSLGWTTQYVTESWFKDLSVGPAAAREN